MSVGCGGGGRGAAISSVHALQRMRSPMVSCLPCGFLSSSIMQCRVPLYFYQADNRIKQSHTSAAAVQTDARPEIQVGSAVHRQLFCSCFIYLFISSFGCQFKAAVNSLTAVSLRHVRDFACMHAARRQAVRTKNVLTGALYCSKCHGAIFIAVGRAADYEWSAVCVYPTRAEPGCAHVLFPHLSFFSLYLIS